MQHRSLIRLKPSILKELLLQDQGSKSLYSK